MQVSFNVFWKGQFYKICPQHVAAEVDLPDGVPFSGDNTYDLLSSLLAISGDNNVVKPKDILGQLNRKKTYAGGLSVYYPIQKWKFVGKPSQTHPP